VSDVKPSKLLLDECFATEDDRFLDVFGQFDSYEFLRSFVAKWVQDKRPWAREQIVRYLQLDWNFPGHEVVVKRLFKHFENQHAHDMMAHFMVAFDRSVRRSRQSVWHYGSLAARPWTEERLFAKANKTIREVPQTYTARNPRTGAEIRVSVPAVRNRPENRLFSHRTRNHLRRRAWRYFRQLSYRKPMAYVAFVTEALKRYKDEDFAVGENILDNWSLMHICYFHHDAIVFTPNHANLAEGRSLAELTPMPYQLSAWRTQKGSLALIELISEANSTLVRLWAMELLQRDHQDAISTIDIPILIKLLSHVDSRVQEWAVELFQRHEGLASLPIETWLELLDQTNLAVLTLVCDAMSKFVTPERLNDAQMIELACARAVPVARMGFDMLKGRHAQQPFSNAEVSRLATAQCVNLSTEITAWALGQIGVPSNYDMDGVTEFFDSLHRPMRQSAMDWLAQEDSPGYNDPALWARLIETPFDDLRLRLVETLESRLDLPGLQADDSPQLWIAVILGVHRGGRTKLKAIRQVADSIADRPQRADRLLPVLGVALRSTRLPERRQALSAIVTMAARQPQLRDSIARHVPELEWVDDAQEATV